VIFGPDIIEEVEATVHRIQDNLKDMKSRQETYANKRRRPLEFEVGKHVYLRVSPTKGVKRFGVKGKLAPPYIGAFSILEKCGTVTYKLDLPSSLVGVHDIFHMSQLKKCLKAPMNIVLPDVTLLETDLSYLKHPIKVLEQKNSATRHKTIKFFKVQWSNHTEKEQLGKAGIFFVLTIWTSCYRSEEMCDCSLFLLEPFLLPNLGSRFLLGGRL
jgi:hypothetical protein